MVGCVLGAPPSVVVLGATLVDGMEALWAALLEVLGVQRCSESGAAVYLRGCVLGVD